MRGVKNGLINNFVIDSETGCWNWTRPVYGDGYPMGMFRGRQMNISRIVACLYLGLYYKDSHIVVLHSCDNPRCVNPKHLLLGTHLANRQDCIDKGRAAHQRRGNFCLRGHALTPDNTFHAVNSNGPYRSCRTCRRDKLRRWRAARTVG